VTDGMSGLDFELATWLICTTGVGFLMLYTGVKKNALEWRRRRRVCPSCGRIITGRTCTAH
jgi:hypothetical protein